MRDPLIGTRINRYEIRESVHKSDVIGIYKAYDTKLERYVLIKTILHSSDYSRDGVDFFLAESRALAKLAHPNIAKVLDFGYENGNLYLISEYVLGQLLSDLMNHPIPWQKAINILLPLTNALIYAHSRGIIHRDIKPDNMIINNDDQPILSDFSLMRIIEEEETRDMTGTNVGLGSPGYISPEQGQGLAVDFRSDIYSLGVIFFEMVTGEKLFYATSSMEIVIQHIMADPPKPRSIIPSLPKMVETIILNALSKDREKRYQTMEEFSSAMKAVIEAANKEKSQGGRRPRRLLVASALAGILLVTAGLGWAFRDRLLPSPSLTPTTTTPQQSSTRTGALPLNATPPTGAPTEDSPPPAVLATSVAGPFAIYKLPALPVLPGTRLPVSDQVMDTNNAASIQELARWGNPSINQLALINNDQVLLAATGAGIYYFDPKDLSARLFFDSAGSISLFAISDDGERIATSDTNGTLAIWNILDGKQQYRLDDLPSKILSLDFSPDGSKLVFSDGNKNIHLWSFQQNQAPYLFEKRLTANANKVMFSDAGDTVVSGGDNFLIMVWDVASGKLKDQFAAAQKINDMAISSDGRYLALALDEALFQIWDLSAQTVVNEIKGTEYGVLKPFTFITFLPNEDNILTGSADGFIRIWNTLVDSEYLWATTSAPQAENPRAVNPIKTVAVSRNGSKIVVGFENGLVEIWDFTSRTLEASKDLGSDPIKRLVMSPDDQFLAFQSGDSSVGILSLERGSEAAQIQGTLPRGYPISPNNQMIGVQDGDLILYPLSASETAVPLFTVYDFPRNGSVNYSPDSKIVTAFSAGDFTYWSIASGLQLKASVLKPQGLCRVLYSRDNSFIAAASENGVILSDKNLDTFCQVTRGARTTSEDFLPDGSIIALSLQNQRVEIWDLRKDSQKLEINIQTPGDVLDVAISNDGKLLAAASAGGTIELYNLETLELIRSLDLKTGPVHHVLFSNNGKYLVSGFADGTLRFFGLHR